MKNIISKFLVAIIAIAFSFLSAASISWAYTIAYKNGFDTYPTKVYCYSGFAQESKDAVHNACAEWNAAGQGDLVYYSSSTHKNTKYPYYNGKNQITKGNRGKNKYGMETSLYSVDGDKSVCEADIDINTYYLWKNDGSSDALDVQNGMTHELGHLLGLDHSSKKSATMYMDVEFGETSKRTLSSDDKKGIAKIYGD